MKKTQKSLNFQHFLLAQEEKQREQLRKNPHKYMLDDTTYVVRKDSSTFWGDLIVMLFVGAIVVGILAKFIEEYVEFPVLAGLFGVMILGTFLRAFAGIYRRVTFNTATGEMTLRRLFRPTWRFHKDEITAMEAQMDREFGRISRLYIHADNRKFWLYLGRINEFVKSSSNPGGIDKTLCDQSNMFELVEFLNVWERAVITERDDKLIK